MPPRDRKPDDPNPVPLDWEATAQVTPMVIGEHRQDRERSSFSSRHTPGPRTLASPALARMARTAARTAEKRPSAPVLESGLRFETVKVVTPGLFRLLCAAFDTPHAHRLVPPVNSFITLRSYTSLLESLPMPFALREPVTDQQPDENYHEFALFRAFLVQASILPWREGERRVRTTARLHSIFESQQKGEEKGFASVPLRHLDALAKAWSWDFRSTTRDTLVTLADDEASSVALVRQRRAIEEERNNLVLATLRASTAAIQSGDPATAKNNLLAFHMIFGQKGAGDFIRDMTTAAPEGGPTITVKGDKGTGRAALMVEWGDPPPGPAKAPGTTLDA
jgi:hypothetical protein